MDWPYDNFQLVFLYIRQEEAQPEHVIDVHWHLQGWDNKPRNDDRSNATYAQML